MVSVRPIINSTIYILPKAKINHQEINTEASTILHSENAWYEFKVRYALTLFKDSYLI